MKVQRAALFFCLSACALGAWASSAQADLIKIATSKGVGADAEVRDHQPSTNFGASTELASRILDNVPAGDAIDGNDRFSAMYLKFDITGQSYPAAGTLVRLTYRNNNLTANRVQDTTPPGNNTSFRTGIAFYGLDRDDPGNAWTESTITYLNAPGMGSSDNPTGIPGFNQPGGDFDNGTKDLDFRDPDPDTDPGPAVVNGPRRAPLTPLGVALFPLIGTQNHLPIGGELILQNTALNNFVKASLDAGKSTITIVACVVHDGKIPVNDWKNFNYLFNPKEMVTLGNDASYDADGSGPIPAGGNPNSLASNAADANGFSPFSPQLWLLPEPSSLGLAGLACAALALGRRRR
jgi:hypothetical protein